MSRPAERRRRETMTGHRRRLKRVLRRLERAYDRPPWRPTRRPLDGLIRTVLSQNTSDVNSDRAFRSLKREFRSWSAVAAASRRSVARAIAGGGLADVKSGYILAILGALTARFGRPTLAPLARRDDARILDDLLALPGVGRKTAACVLMFDLGRAVLPVDTHVHRVAGRLGLVPPRTTANRAHDLLGAIVAPADVHSLHVNLIRLGRRVCTAARPRCGDCPLRPVCPAGTGRGTHGRGGRGA